MADERRKIRLLYRVPGRGLFADRAAPAAVRSRALVDAGTLRTTLGYVLGPINAADLRRAHRLLEERRAIGKLGPSGFCCPSGIGGAVTPTVPLCKQGNTWPLRTASRRVAC
jgi:hypothetical protein